MTATTSTSTEFVIDTNVAIAFLNDAKAAAARIRVSALLSVPVAVWGELFYGAEKSSQVTSNLARIERFTASVRTLPCDLGTAREYGRIRKALRTQGTPIPDNDIWIAASAIQQKLPLLSADSHFRHVAGLTIEKW